MTITTTQLKGQMHLLDIAKKEDIRVTKRGRPFAVIVDAQRYEELLANEKKTKKIKKQKALEAMGSYALGASDIEDIKASMYNV